MVRPAPYAYTWVKRERAGLEPSWLHHKKLLTRLRVSLVEKVKNTPHIDSICTNKFSLLTGASQANLPILCQSGRQRWMCLYDLYGVFLLMYLYDRICVIVFAGLYLYDCSCMTPSETAHCFQCSVPATACLVAHVARASVLNSVHRWRSS